MGFGASPSTGAQPSNSLRLGKFLNVVRNIRYDTKRSETKYKLTIMENSQNALSIGLAVATSLICLTLVSVYTAFGPPSKKLGDPYEDHED